MGLSLQLLVYLSRLLENNGLEQAEATARHLEAIARSKAPDLFSISDPNNTHTRILACLALGEALKSTGGGEDGLGLANALQWILKKEMTPDQLKGLDSKEVQIARGAEKQLQLYYERVEGDDYCQAWRPGQRTEAARQINTPDPMLVPDVSVASLARFSSDHGIKPHPQEKKIEGGTPEKMSNHDQEEVVCPINEGQPLLTLMKNDDSDLNEKEDLAVSDNETRSTEEAVSPVEIRAHKTNTLIEMTGYTTEEPEEPQKAKTGRGLDFGLAIMLALSVCLPPAAIFFCGFLVGKKRIFAGILALIAGLAGWFGWRTWAGMG